MPRDLSPEELQRYGGGGAPALATEAGWGTRLGAAFDRAGADLIGVGEAMGLDSLAESRRARQMAGELGRQRAVRDTQTAGSWDDVGGVGDLPGYVGGLIVDSAPELAISAATGLATGGLGLGLSTAGRLGVGAAAMYPSAVGDVLSNQREQAGRTDLGSAAFYGVPYTAANMIGVEGALMRGALGRGIGEVASGAGASRWAARRGASIGINMLEEGASETFQEGMNQLGRMAVDDQQAFLDDDSRQRFKESFIGGALMGGAFGAVSRNRRDSTHDAVNGNPLPEADTMYGPFRPGDFGPEPLPEPDQTGPFRPGDFGPEPAHRNPELPTVVVGSDGTAMVGPDEATLAAYDRYGRRAPEPTGPFRPGDFGPEPQPRTLADQGMPADWTTSPGAAPDYGNGIDYEVGMPTGNLTLLAPIDAPTPDMFGGPARTAEDMAPDGRPEFDLVPDDTSGAGQMELDFTAPAAPVEPVTPIGNQRGISGQLPFSPNTRSPKGQVLQGLVDSLAAENHMDEGTYVQVSTMIANGKFAAAKKAIDNAVKEKKAADALVNTASKVAERAVGDTAVRTDDTGAGAAPAGRDGGAGNADAGAEQAGATAPVGVPSAAPEGAAPAADGRTGEDGTGDGAVTEQLAALTDEQVVQRVDNAVSDADYEAALDEMYRRWATADADIPTFEQYLDQAFGADTPAAARKAFGNDWNAAEQRFNSKMREGRRGLRMGQSAESTRSSIDPDTDAIMRGLPRTLANRGTGTTAMPGGAMNPDAALRTEAGIPAEEVSRWRNGGDALRYLARKGSSPFIRFLAQRLEPYVRNVSLHVIDPNSPRTQPWMRREMQKGVRGMFTPDNGMGQPYVAVRNDSTNETVLMHELIHAAVFVRMQDRNVAREFERLTVNVSRALRTMSQMPSLTAEERNAAQFFLDMFSDPKDGVDEYVAYTLTSPVFQHLAKRLDANGNLLPDQPTRSSATRPTLWQRFVDAVLSLFNIPKVYADATENIIKSAYDSAQRGGPLLTSNIEALGRVLSATDGGPQPPTTGPRFNREASPAAVGEGVRGQPEVSKLVAQLADSPIGKTSLVERLKELAFNLRESRGLLRWMTNDQIAESFKHIKGLRDINRATGRMARVANNQMEITAQVAKRWNALASRNEAAALEMQRLMLETTMDQMHVSIKVDGRYLSAPEAFRHESNKHLSEDQQAAFNELHRRFMALPEQARQVYDAARDDLAAKHKQTITAMENSVISQYAATLGAAPTTGTVAERVKALEAAAKTQSQKRTVAQLKRALRDMREELGTINGPYFPLVRFGDNVVVMRSKALNDMVEQAEAAKADLQAAIEREATAAEEHKEAAGAAVDAARTAYQDATRRVENMKREGQHYEVQFHEKPYGARKAAEALTAANPDAQVYETKRETYMRGLDGASPAFMREMQNTLSSVLDAGSGVDSNVRQRALDAINDMYLRRQPERSALRSELRRMGVEGVKAGEMLRGYAQAGRNGAWRISRLMHGGEVVQGLAKLGEDKSPEARDVLNEMKQRFVNDYAEPNDSRLVQSAQQATYFMHLGFNLSYWLTNATQAWVVSMPVLGGRHGLARTANELGAASKEVVAALKDATVESIEENGVVVGLQLRLTDEQLSRMGKTDGERAMLRDLTNDGVIDITIKHDMGAITDGTGGVMSKMVEMSGALANFPELYNRLTTSLAAYRMELGRQGTGEAAHAKATEYAENIINRTHFNYAPENAPRVMRGNLGRLVFQFRRYQQGMVYLFSTLAKKAWGGDPEARKSFFWLLGTHFGVAGAAGVPMAAPMALIAKIISSMYPDDDEPELMQMFYNGMKDSIGETAARVVAKGLPTLVGVDVTGKLGAGDIFSPVPFARTEGKETFSREWMVEVAFAGMGAGMGQLAKQGETLRLLQDGELGRAAANGAPNFIANGIKAWREADRGVQSRSGDVLIDPSEFGIGETITRAMGFQGVRTSDMYDQRGAFMEMVQNRKEARSKLMRGYYDAVRQRDPQRMADVRAQIDAFNKRQPADRIDRDDLRRGMAAKTSSEMRGGLRVRDRDEDTYRRLVGED